MLKFLTMTGKCPECEAIITLGETTEPGEIVICPDYGVDLEITSIVPAVLALAPGEAEDFGE